MLTLFYFHSGIDLNRNFNFQWGCCGGSSSSACSLTYRGAAPLSEPESIGVANLMNDTLTEQRTTDTSTPAPDNTIGMFLDIHR